MAKISELTAAGALTGSETLAGVQGAASVKITTQDIANLYSGLSNPLTANLDTGGFSIVTANAATANDISITAGDSTSGEGGDLTLTAGSDSANGGDIQIYGGAGTDMTAPSIRNVGAGSWVMVATSGTGNDRSGGSFNIGAGNADGTGTPGSVSITSGDAGTSGNGADITVEAGDGNSGNGGSITIQGGHDAGATAATDANIVVQGFQGSQAGNVNITSGSHESGGEGGNINLTAGDATGSDAGNINIEAGASTSGDGGTITLTIGDGSADDGTIELEGRVNVKSIGSASGDLNIETADPTFIMTRTGAAADEGKWWIRDFGGGYLAFQSVTDSEGSTTTWLEVHRGTGKNIDNLKTYDPIHAPNGWSGGPSYSFYNATTHGVHYNADANYGGVAISANSNEVLSVTEYGLRVREMTAPGASQDATGYGFIYNDTSATDGRFKVRDAGGNDYDLLSDLGEYTVATLPSASDNANCYALATDASGGRTIVRSDGTNWKVVVVEGATVTT